MLSPRIKKKALMMVLATLYVNVAGWWLFPRWMLFVVPVSFLVLFAIGQFLRAQEEK